MSDLCRGRAGTRHVCGAGNWERRHQISPRATDVSGNKIKMNLTWDQQVWYKTSSWLLRIDLLDLREHRPLAIRTVGASILPEAPGRMWMADLNRVTLCSETRYMQLFALQCQSLKGQFNQKYKLFHELLTLMSFQTCKTFVHFQNAN